MTREEQQKKAQKAIDGYRAAAAVFPIVRRVIEQYDGKVYNRRLSEALKAAVGETGSIYAEKKDNNYIEIMYSPRGNYQWQYLLWISAKKALPDGKRIDAAAIVKQLKEKRTDFLRRAYELEDAGRNVDQIQAQLDKWVKALAATLDPIPREAREIYELSVKNKVYWY